MSEKTALIIDDEPDICELVEITLSRMGLKTQSAYNIESAHAYLAQQSFDLCLTDMQLPDGNGLDLVEHIQSHYPDIPVAVITAHGNMDSAIRALKAGAFDFVSKPVDLHILRNLVKSATQLPSTNTEHQIINNADTLLGESKVIEELRKKINKLARSQAPVFIHGESGCGKELVAKTIHSNGSRSAQPFIPVNCGAIPAELMESEFFGHRKGAFTGASHDKEGLFMAANNGTLFLDEVADLPLHMQVKLLRAIQEKAIRPVGDHQEHPIDVRILSASHKNLVELVKQGKFREDLFYRINVIELYVPALREHAEDIPILTHHLLTNMSRNSGRRTQPQVSENAQHSLINYPFPGNVRELENILERALTLSEGDVIHKEDLQLSDISTNIGTTPDVDTDISNNHLVVQTDEKNQIIQALEQTRWNKTAAARLLGITLRQLRYRLNKFGIQ